MAASTLLTHAHLDLTDAAPYALPTATDGDHTARARRTQIARASAATAQAPMTLAPSGAAGPTPWVLPLFFLSGACSVGLEVIWAKQLGIVLGGTTTGVAFVVALFMGGMAIGYAIGGRIAPRATRPLVLYGAAELGLGTWGLCTVHLAPRLEGAFSPVATYLAAGALLLPCTVLAGATLPLLVEGTRGSVGATVGKLYGLNTLGAVVGVLATGMVSIGALGLATSALVLALLASSVGLCAVFLGRRRRGELATGHDRSAARVTPVPAAAREASREHPAPGDGRTRSAALALLVGFASLAEEVLWTRASVAHLSSSTYALSSILAVFLLGLALGAAIAAHMLERGFDPARVLVVTQLAAAVFVLTSPEALGLAEELVPGYVGIRELGELGAWVLATSTTFSRALFSLVVPTVLLGFALPLLAELHARSQVSRARAIGELASWNTIGAVAGSLGARFALLPALGVGASLRALAVVHAIVAAVAAFRRPQALRALIVAAAIAVVAVVRPSAAPFLGRLTGGYRLLFVEEGVQDTTAVIELGRPGGPRQIVTNGIAYAGDTPEAQRYMRMLAHLPALLARQQRSALVICLGTGMTASAVARHRAFRRIDLVDISPVVYRTLPLFARSNDRVYASPRARIHVEDGRVFLAHARPGSYDLITLEPPPPRVAGVSALYSREFYLLARRALADGGAFAQWLPVHGMTGSELRMLARTFTDVFPEAALYRIQRVEVALVAVRGRGASERAVAQRLAAPTVAAQLAVLGVPSPLALPSVRGPALVAALGPGPIVTDDRPRIEHFAATLAREAPSTELAGQQFLDDVLGSPRPDAATH